MAPPRIPADLRCPICGGVSFDEVLSRSDGKHLTGRHPTTLMVCTECSYVYTFFGRR